MPLPVDYPEEVCFSCTECGDCCRSWDVLVGPGERDRLAALEWHGREADLVGARVVEPVGGGASRGRQGLAPSPAAPPRQRLARGADGACVYLGAENQCRIHQHFGEAAKPLLCRLYPFSFYAMGERTSVDVSFYCRSVSQGDGAPIATRLGEWTRLLASRDLTDTRQHELRANVRVDGGLVWEVEHHLLQFLKDDSLTLIERVRCVLQFVRLATTGDPDQPTASALRAAMAKGIPLQVRGAPLEATMDKTQRAIFYQWLHLALNPAPPSFDTLSSVEQAQVRDARERAGRRYRDRAGRPHVDGNELAVDFGRIAAVDTSVFAENNCAPLRDFLCAKIVGQKFLIAGEDELPLVEATLMFLLTVPMTIWTAKALAAERGATAVEACDLRQAIRLIDRTLGQISTSLLPPKQREAYDWVMLETDLVEAATADVLVG